MSSIGGTLGALESSRVLPRPRNPLRSLPRLSGAGEEKSYERRSQSQSRFLCCFSRGLQRNHFSELWAGRSGEWTEGVWNFLILVPCKAGNSAARHAVSTKRWETKLPATRVSAKNAAWLRADGGRRMRGEDGGLALKAGAF